MHQSATMNTLKSSLHIRCKKMCSFISLKILHLNTEATRLSCLLIIALIEVALIKKRQVKLKRFNLFGLLVQRTQ